MGDRLIWTRDGRDWPNREASRFVRAAGFQWHVQKMGLGPAMLLAHGTGASTHSWRALLPILARRFTVVAPDLPGHGFTGLPAANAMSLPGMARGLAELMRVLGVVPQIVVGHSAGAAILARMCLDGMIAPRALVAINGALLPLRGPGVQLFAPLARAMAGLPFVPRLFAWRAADRAVIEKLLADTGSRLDADGVKFYARLAQSPGHVEGALSMMANWDLVPLDADLPRLKPRLTLIVGSNDRTISPDDARRVRALVPGAVIVSLPGLGHLAHEEKPAEVAEIIVRAFG